MSQNNVQFINNLSGTSGDQDTPLHTHEPGGALHSHDLGPGEHGHTHEHLESAGKVNTLRDTYARGTDVYSRKSLREVRGEGPAGLLVKEL